MIDNDAAPVVSTRVQDDNRIPDTGIRRRIIAFAKGGKLGGTISMAMGGARAEIEVHKGESPRSVADRLLAAWQKASEAER